jgi:hypothetical protein
MQRFDAGGESQSISVIGHICSSSWRGTSAVLLSTLAARDREKLGPAGNQLFLPFLIREVGPLGEPGMISINQDAQDGPGDPGSPRGRVTTGERQHPPPKALGTTFYDQLGDSLGKSADCSGGIDA